MPDSSCGFVRARARSAASIQPLDLVQTAGVHRDPGLGQAQRGVGARRLVAERLEPAGHRLDAAALKERVPVLGDQLARERDVAAGDRVVDRRRTRRAPGTTPTRGGGAPAAGRAGCARARGAGAPRTGGGSGTTPAWCRAGPGTARRARAVEARRRARGPVTASHSGPDRRSSTEVLSRNSRTSGGWPSSTS